MKNRTMQILLVLTGLIIGTGASLYARKIPLTPWPTPSRERKISPLEQHFSKPASLRNVNRGNRVLMLLVEFQKEVVDDPMTTGDGTFVQDIDDFPGGAYPQELSLAKPPHNHEFFSLHADALKYYYYGASSGSLNLIIDIYPQPQAGVDFAAYTLPNPMAYYHPAGATNDVMIQRFEEYFADVFAAADADENINFQLYDHFMFIHAGSDWQHDVNGDTPSDIPSFFIQMGTGKEVYVDDGIMIDHACNVPEMITQDITFEMVNGKPNYYNYGLINAVMAHEFGHSLGFVDLYNTSNFSPGVGYFEIMDNGGSGAIFVQGTNGNYIMEGGLPVYPGAWHRIKVWGDTFADRGVYQNLDQLPLDSEITMLPAETMIYPTQSTEDPLFIKVPISEKEYILLENRQVDPDGDGGAFAEVSDNGWVILYPSSTDPHDHDPNYEYDFFLPGWSDINGNVHGGGIIAWHIDDKRIYEDGVYNSAGEFVNNHDANTVNAWYGYQGVKIVEADNIEDIGNTSSLYWNGTPYEPFYRYQPILDDRGFFMGWDDETIVQPNGNQLFIGEYHNPELSSFSHPALQTNTGEPSFFRIYDISSFSVVPHEPRIMTLKIGTSLFENTRALGTFNGATHISDIGTNMGFPSILLAAHRSLKFLFNVAGEWGNHFNLSIPFEGKPHHPIIAADRDGNGESEFLITDSNTLYSATPDGITEQSYPDSIIETPLWLPQYNRLVVSTTGALYSQGDSLNIAAAQCIFDGEQIIAVSSNCLYHIDAQSFTIINQQSFPFSVTHYAPVAYKDANPAYSAVLVQNDQGKIYRLQNGDYTEIFDPEPYSSAMPTQLALGQLQDDGQTYVCFGLGDHAFAISLSGTMAPTFPALMEETVSQARAFPRIVELQGTTLLYIPDEDNGWVAVKPNGRVDLSRSYSWAQSALTDRMQWHDTTLHYFFIKSAESLFAATTGDFDQSSLLWSGYRHNQGTASGAMSEPIAAETITAFAYPNPATSSEVRIKVIGTTEAISLKVFDIAGNRVFSKQVDPEPNQQQDIRWDISHMASGVYYALVRTMGQTRRVPVAIEK